MAASTPRTCLRSESVSIHPHTSSHASSRVGSAMTRCYPSRRPMEKFVIQGGAPLSGEITAAGNKNAALPILAACLLTDEEVILNNVPRIRDTESQVALLEGLGVKVDWSAQNELRLQADAVSDTSVDEELAARIRASFLLAGPLLARFGEVRMPPPGGDFIGRRRLDPHLDAFADMGARVEGDRWIELSAPNGGLAPCGIFMDEPSVMATENALMAAALTPGPTTIGNAACEPHVQDLARLLIKMGADIDGVGSNVMTVHGRDKLGGAERSDDDQAPVPAPGPDLARRRQRRAGPAGAGPSDQVRHRRRDPEDRGRPVAGLPGGLDLDRARARHAGRWADPDLREDVREPPVLRRQAGCDGRTDHPLRSPPGDRAWSVPSSRRARRQP